MPSCSSLAVAHALVFSAGSHRFFCTSALHFDVVIYWHFGSSQKNCAQLRRTVPNLTRAGLSGPFRG
ncbi:hypothetical protein PSAC2689_30301 [Paraburkholderia sacchari]